MRYSLRDGREVGADDQRALHGGPQGKVRAGLGEAELVVADFEHVAVGVAPEVDCVQLEGVHVQDGCDVAPSRYVISAN